MIPHFIVDEQLEELQNTIKDLIHEHKHPELKKNTKTLRTFTRAIAHSLVKPKSKIYKQIQKQPIQLQLVKEPVGYDISPAPLPGEKEKGIHEFKAIPIYAEQIIARKQPIKPEQQIISLIKDKFTNKVLATANVNDTYKVNEPNLDEADKKVLDKVRRKKPKNPEKVWKLIEKYVKKYKANPAHKEAIKYYVINNIFALGKIEPLLNDKNISVITCDSPGSHIKVKRNDKKLKTNLLFSTKQELDNFLLLIAAKTNSKLNKKHPVMDATYRNFRFHCVLGLDITSSKFTITRI